MSIYKQLILEHYKHPSNSTPLKKADITSALSNPSCGDKIKFSLEIKNKIITKVSQQSSGCVISKASSSILSDYIIGKSIDEILSLNNQDVLSKLGIELTYSRIKCAILPLETVKKALHKSTSINYHKIK